MFPGSLSSHPAHPFATKLEIPGRKRNLNTGHREQRCWRGGHCQPLQRHQTGGTKPCPLCCPLGSSRGSVGEARHFREPPAHFQVGMVMTPSWDAGTHWVLRIRVLVSTGWSQALVRAPPPQVSLPSLGLLRSRPLFPPTPAPQPRSLSIKAWAGACSQGSVAIGRCSGCAWLFHFLTAPAPENDFGATALCRALLPHPHTWAEEMSQQHHQTLKILKVVPVCAHSTWDVSAGDVRLGGEFLGFTWNQHDLLFCSGNPLLRLYFLNDSFPTCVCPQLASAWGVTAPCASVQPLLSKGFCFQTSLPAFVFMHH